MRILYRQRQIDTAIHSMRFQWKWYTALPPPPPPCYSTSMNQFFHVRRVKYGGGIRAYPDIGIFGGCPVPTGGTTVKVRWIEMRRTAWSDLMLYQIEPPRRRSLPTLHRSCIQAGLGTGRFTPHDFLEFNKFILAVDRSFLLIYI